MKLLNCHKERSTSWISPSRPPTVGTSPRVCATSNLPVARIDQLVLQRLAERVTQLLRYLVQDIRVEVGQVTMRGSVDRMKKTVAEMNMGAVNTVPIFMHNWCPRHESNVRPSP